MQYAVSTHRTNQHDCLSNMCVAGLNVSTQPCAHRWYELVRPCHPANSLANCPEKLKLEGWENRKTTCPWCDSDEAKVPESTHRLFGITSSASSTASSPKSSDIGFGRARRSGSDSISSLESDRGQKHRDMNDRLHLYLLSDPHEVLPSARKNYPSYPQGASGAAASSNAPPLKRTSTALSNGWKRSVKLSVNTLKF